MSILTDTLNKWYALYKIPQVEKQIEHIEKELSFFERGFAGTHLSGGQLEKIQQLKVARDYLIHKSDYLRGWT